MQAENDRLDAAVSNLRTLIAALPKEGKDEFCELVGLRLNYVYRIIGGHVHNMTGKTLFAMEDASRKLHAKYGTPIVTARELSAL